jgi:hypothetical protein
VTKDKLIEALAKLPGDAEVMIDIKGWDEPLNLTACESVQVYDPVPGADFPFATITPSQEGATRLDPMGA